jgi:hypothetical protein
MQQTKYMDRKQTLPAATQASKQDSLQGRLSIRQ